MAVPLVQRLHEPGASLVGAHWVQWQRGEPIKGGRLLRRLTRSAEEVDADTLSTTDPLSIDSDADGLYDAPIGGSYGEDQNGNGRYDPPTTVSTLIAQQDPDETTHVDPVWRACWSTAKAAPSAAPAASCELDASSPDTDGDFVLDHEELAGWGRTGDCALARASVWRCVLMMLHVRGAWDALGRPMASSRSSGWMACGGRPVAPPLPAGGAALRSAGCVA